MRVWVTKYALTDGIKELEVEQNEKFPEMVSVIGSKWNENYHGEGIEWHKTFDSAKSKAEEMRLKKIVSLNKQIKKYEKMKF